MEPAAKKQNLEHDHTPERIKERLKSGARPSYLGDFLLGAIDGVITTFAIVAGVTGAGLSNKIAVILGTANLLADGFSMAAGNYQKARSDQELLDRARGMEERHIDTVPEGEREEIRQIFSAKGFQGQTLEDAVKIITSDRKRWVDTMITDELGMRIQVPSPLKSSLTTFWAFCVMGFIPLLPFVFFLLWSGPKMFFVSAVFTALTFFVVGSVKGKIVQRNWLFSGLETLFIGGFAAALAYIVGAWLKGWALS